VSNPVVEWSYRSRDDELEAIRWYLTGHLDAQTKLDLEWGAAVNAYEHLRHVVKLPNRARSLQVPLKLIRTAWYFLADAKTELHLPQFPELPFGKLSPTSKNSVLRRFNGAEYPAFHPMDITEVHDWGVLEDLAKLYKASKRSEDTVVAEVEVSPQQSVIVCSIDFDAGPARAEHWFKRWIETNKHRFAKAGRSQAGTRAKNSPLIELKDLAVARLLALHSFNSNEASRWARSNQPRDSEGKKIPWFNKRSAKNGGAVSALFKEHRDWNRAASRFEKNLLTYLVRQ
jgi:hypothetical protein